MLNRVRRKIVGAVDSLLQTFVGAYDAAVVAQVIELIELETTVADDTSASADFAAGQNARREEIIDLLRDYHFTLLERSK